MLSIMGKYLRAPAAIARHVLSTVAKYVNSPEHFVNLNADSLRSWGPKNKSCGIEYVSVNFSGLLWLCLYMKKTLCKLNKAAYFKYVDLSSITLKISLLLLEPLSPNK